MAEQTRAGTDLLVRLDMSMMNTYSNLDGYTSYIICSHSDTSFS